MKRYHVYCTCCINGKKLMDAYYVHKDKDLIPKKCKDCYPYDHEDSRGIDLRVNYKESLSGWWWLTKWDILDYFRYRKWRKSNKRKVL